MVDEKHTTVYKRAAEVSYQLKMKASRELLSVVGKKYPTMLFRWVLGEVGGCGGWAGRWGLGRAVGAGQGGVSGRSERGTGAPVMGRARVPGCAAAKCLGPEPACPLRLRACSLRGIEAKQARFGLVECLNHGLLTAYPVSFEKEGELVAHVSLC